jgi:cytoskeletal protein CcmA (bactofilin family)
VTISARFLARSRPLALAALAVVGAGVVACRSPGPIDEGVAVFRGGDLVAVHRDMVVRDTVSGDVMAAGDDIRFTGAAGGDLLTAGRTHVLAGATAGSVRAAGSYVLLGTAVERNVTVAGRTVVVDRRSRIRGNAYLAGGTVRMEGQVGRLLRVMGGDVVLNGTVGGDVLVEARRLQLGPDAVIEGDLRYRLGRGQDAVVHPRARVDGNVIGLPGHQTRWIPWAFRLFWLVAFLFAGIIVVALLPGLARAGELRIRARPLISFLVGLITLVVAPLLIVAIAITVIGLPLALVGAALYGVSVYLGPILVGVWLGLLLRSRSSTYAGRGQLVGAFLLGGLILGLLGLIPYAGWVIQLLVAVLGLGAMIVALWEGPAETRPARA